MTYYDLSLKETTKYPIVLAKVGSQIHELSDTVKDMSESVEYLTTGDSEGMKTYQRSLVFLFLTALHKIDQQCHANIQFTLGDALYIESDYPVFRFQDLKDNILSMMRDMVNRNIVFKKDTVSLSSAMEYFKENGMTEKEKLFKYRRVSSINLYDLDGVKNYFYGDLVYSTGVLQYFDLESFSSGLLLKFPNFKRPDFVDSTNTMDNLFGVLAYSSRWAKKLNAKTIGDLNDAIVNGNMKHIVLMQEAAMESQIASIAKEIANSHHRIVMIAGPSSSGKTSFSNRLAIALQTRGINCHTIAQDDYFKNRADIPFDSNGEQNFENIDVVDLDLFDKDMNLLLDGATVEIPHFNFVTGCREYRGDHYITLKDDEVVIIEGIHCLNPRFLPSVHPYRIYISALNPLAIDEHNRISSSDLRMLRRMARDIRGRGTNPQATIKSWHKVRRGEEDNIFPYQENADVIFNSSLVYEVPMLKTLVEPMLFSVPKDSNEWGEAKRLLKFLDFFLAYPDDLVPRYSLLQEFLGNSCFDV